MSAWEAPEASIAAIAIALSLSFTTLSPLPSRSYKHDHRREVIRGHDEARDNPNASKIYIVLTLLNVMVNPSASQQRVKQILKQHQCIV